MKRICSIPGMLVFFSSDSNNLINDPGKEISELNLLIFSNQ